MSPRTPGRRGSVKGSVRAVGSVKGVAAVKLQDWRREAAATDGQTLCERFSLPPGRVAAFRHSFSFTTCLWSCNMWSSVGRHPPSVVF